MTVDRPVIEFLAVETFASGVWTAWTDQLTEVRIERGGQQKGVSTSVDVGLMTATLINSGDPLVDPSLHPNLPIRLRYTTNDKAVYTGTLQDLYTDYAINPLTRDVDVFVSIVACDAVAEHNRVKVSGAVTTGGAGFETWAARITRLAASATTSVELPANDGSVAVYEFADQSGLDGWAAVGTLPANTTAVAPGVVVRTGAALVREITRSGSVSYVAQTLYTQRTFTGLEIGKTYRLDAKARATQTSPAYTGAYRVMIAGVTSISDPTATITDTSTYHDFFATFVATATSHDIRLVANSAFGTGAGSGYFEAVEFSSIKLSLVPATTTARLQDVALVAPLAEHFDLASNSIGGSWYVDRDNVTQFRMEAIGNLEATYSDVRGTGLKEYSGIRASYDTRNVVNILDVTNHGRNAGTGQASDLELTETDTASVASWGPRPGSTDLCIYAGYVLYTNLMPQPGFEGGSTTMGTDTATGASARAIVTSSPSPHSGTNSLRWTAAAGDSNMRFAPDGSAGWQAATPGQVWRVSFWLRSSVARNIQAMVRFYSSASGGTGILATTSSVAATSSTSAWTRYTISATAPASTQSVAGHVLTVSNSAGQFHYIDDVFVGVTSDDPTSFSGDTPDTDDYGYEWAGTVNASSSIQRSYVDLAARIVEIFDDWGEPLVRVSELRWNAQEDTALASRLEIQSRIGVTFRGDSYESRVVGMTHEISPTQWMTTLKLIPV